MTQGLTRGRAAPCQSKARTLARPITLIAAAAMFAFAAPVQAQEIVYDPTNYGKLIEQAETGLRQLQQLQSQVQQASASTTASTRPPA